ncbi:hypothetical protein V6N12_045585 [Hibiscus sabdariffa]|uniref:Uncharacterized protein n=1 Tax=Hibiscus sabdariffa TaxID=183260 RepID=A0ABR2G358_9ROSI
MKPFLTNWLPPGLALSSVGSSGMPMPADPGENDVRNDAVMMAHSAMIRFMCGMKLFFATLDGKKRELLVRLWGTDRALQFQHSEFLIQLDIDLRAEL